MSILDAFQDQPWLRALIGAILAAIFAGLMVSNEGGSGTAIALAVVGSLLFGGGGAAITPVGSKGSVKPSTLAAEKWRADATYAQYDQDMPDMDPSDVAPDVP